MHDMSAKCQSISNSFTHVGKHRVHSSSLLKIKIPPGLHYLLVCLSLTAQLERKIQATEMRFFRRLLDISYRDHVTNEEVRNRIRQAIGPYEDLLNTVKKRKLRWYGHKTRSTGLAKMILQGTVQGGRRRGSRKARWEDNVTEWTGLKLGEALRKAENREEWRKVVTQSSLVPQQSTRLRDK